MVVLPMPWTMIVTVPARGSDSAMVRGIRSLVVDPDDDELAGLLAFGDAGGGEADQLHIGCEEPRFDDNEPRGDGRTHVGVS